MPFSSGVWKKFRFDVVHAYFRSGLTKIDCVLCGKTKKDIEKRKNKNNENSSSFRCECPDVSYSQPCMKIWKRGANSSPMEIKYRIGKNM